MWDPLRKLFAPLTVPSWLRAWLQVRENGISLREWSVATTQLSTLEETLSGNTDSYCVAALPAKQDVCIQ